MSSYNEETRIFTANDGVKYIYLITESDRDAANRHNLSTWGTDEMFLRSGNTELNDHYPSRGLLKPGGGNRLRKDFKNFVVLLEDWLKINPPENEFGPISP